MSSSETLVEQLPAGYEDVPHHAVRLKPRRRAIARSMESAARIPSLTADVQVDLTRLLTARAEHNGSPGLPSEEHISVMAFVGQAAVSCLVEFPHFNATFTERTALVWDTINLGVAVDAPGGLIVPVVRDCQTLGLRELSSAVKGLARRATNGLLAQEDLIAGTFTLSNPGSVGPCIRAEALLNPPQVALLGLPGIRRQPLVVGSPGDDERVEIRSVLSPSLTFDHRALDGGDAVRFLAALKLRVESWDLAAYLAAPNAR